MLELLNSEPNEKDNAEKDLCNESDSFACDAFQVCGCMCAQQQIYTSLPD